MSALAGCARAGQSPSARQTGRPSIRGPPQPIRPLAHPAAATAATASEPSPAAPAALVYSGPGAGTRSVLSALHSLREALVPAVAVATLDAAELLEGGWRRRCLLLVMPGGADLPYCKHLDGRGNALIREYVEGGGAYLGLCAGAYYACARVEFEKGTRLEVVGDRELRFFPGTAAGSIYEGFCYESERGAVAARLRFLCLDPAGSDSGGSGGGGSGGGGGGCWQAAEDYVNGGPGFFLPGDPAAASACGAAPREWSQQPPLQAEQAAQRWQEAGVQVLATYPQRGGAVAALHCRVGDRGGCAVLCGSHPELAPSWLAGHAPGAPEAPAAGRQQASHVADGLGLRAAAVAAAAEAACDERVGKLQAALQAAQPQRWRFWRSLLLAAGLRPWMRGCS